MYVLNFFVCFLLFLFVCLFYCCCFVGLLFDSATDTLTLSPIFEWFSADFKKEFGGVLDYMIRILPDDIAHQINNHPPTMKYFDYDWDVNGIPPCKC